MLSLPTSYNGQATKRVNIAFNAPSCSHPHSDTTISNIDHEELDRETQTTEAWSATTGGNGSIDISSVWLTATHWWLHWTILMARSLHWTILAVSLDATVYFVAHCINFNVTTGGAGADYIIETHHWFMEEMRETDTGEDWNGQSDCYCYY